MQIICTLLQVGRWVGFNVPLNTTPCSRQVTMPAPYHPIFTGRMLFLTPNQHFQTFYRFQLKSRWLCTTVVNNTTQNSSHSNVCAEWLQAYEWRWASIPDVISRFPEHHRDIIAEFTISFVVVVVDDGNLARRRRGCRGRAARTKQFGITVSVLLLPFCASTINASANTSQLYSAKDAAQKPLQWTQKHKTSPCDINCSKFATFALLPRMPLHQSSTNRCWNTTDRPVMKANT